MTTYYISPTGNDSNAGTSTGDGDAWLTFSKANSTLTAGDTVNVMAGTYTGGSNHITPANNGTSGNVITYQNYQSDTVTISGTGSTYGGADLRGEKAYITIDGINMDSTKYWIYCRDSGPGTHHIIVRNCDFDETDDGWGGFYVDSGSAAEALHHHWTIQNCTFVGLCDPDDSISWARGSSYLLVEDCTFSYAAHDGLTNQPKGSGDGYYSVIRNCTFDNGYHVNINWYTNSHWAVFEDNVIKNAGVDRASNSCGSAADRALAFQYHPGLQLGSSFLIVRRNQFLGNGNAIGHASAENGSSTTQYNRMYNNVFYDNHYGFYANTTGPVTENIYKNNIFHDNNQHVRHTLTHADRKNYFFNNNFSGTDSFDVFPYGSSLTLSWLETNLSSYWADSNTDAPAFTTEGSDFTLQAGSDMIDAGAFLTTAVGAGTSSTTLVVDDARYFFNGFGLVDGDDIQFEGQTTTYRVDNINYDTNTIELTSAATWTSGLGVALPYNGSAPDLGYSETVASGDVSVSVSAQALTTSLPAETVTVQAAIAVGVQSLSVSFGIPTITVSTEANVDISVAEQVCTVSMPTIASVSTDAGATAGLQELTYSIPTYTVSTGTGYIYGDGLHMGLGMGLT